MPRRDVWAAYREAQKGCTNVIQPFHPHHLPFLSLRSALQVASTNANYFTLGIGKEAVPKDPRVHLEADLDETWVTRLG